MIAEDRCVFPRCDEIVLKMVALAGVTEQEDASGQVEEKMEKRDLEVQERAPCTMDVAVMFPQDKEKEIPIIDFLLFVALVLIVFDAVFSFDFS